MNKVFTVYDKDTGRIIRHGFCPANAIERQVMSSNEAVLEGGEVTAIDDGYVVDGEIVPRPTITVSKMQIAADDVDAAIIENLPDNCRVVIDDAEYTVQGGRLEITSPMPATYRVVVPEHFPWRELTVEIVAK